MKMYVSTSCILALAHVAPMVSAFPWMANIPGIDLSIIHEHEENFAKPKQRRQGLDPTCPFNPEHPGAAPFDPAFPYTGSIGGLPGTGIGGIQVVSRSANSNDHPLTSIRCQRQVIRLINLRRPVPTIFVRKPNAVLWIFADFVPRS
jgi:hypothetical protein